MTDMAPAAQPACPLCGYPTRRASSLCPACIAERAADLLETRAHKKREAALASRRHQDRLTARRQQGK